MTDRPTTRQRGNVRTLPSAQRDLTQRPPSPRGRLGRPSLLTDEVADVLVGAMREGVPIRHAAALAGVSEQVVHNWRNRATNALTDAGYVVGQEFDATEALARIDEREHPYIELLWRMESVRSERLAAQLAKIGRANDWRATAWLLKHEHPETYGDRLDVGVSVAVDIESPRDALLERIARLRAQAIDTEATEQEDAG